MTHGPPAAAYYDHPVTTAGATPEPSSDATRDFAIEAARLLADRKCEDVRLFDVRGLSQVSDFLLVASGTSDRQMKSVAHEVADEAKVRGIAVFRQNADAGNTWVVIDLVDLVVHLFEPQTRLFYDLESLWDDAERIDWRRDDQSASHRFQGEIGLAYD